MRLLYTDQQRYFYEKVWGENIVGVTQIIYKISFLAMQTYTINLALFSFLDTNRYGDDLHTVYSVEFGVINLDQFRL